MWEIHYNFLILSIVVNVEFNCFMRRLILIVLIFCLFSCSKETQPTTGELALALNLEEVTANGDNLSGSYTLYVDEDLVSVDALGQLNLIEDFYKGTHSSYAYNNVEGLSVIDSVAVLFPSAGVVGSLVEPLYFGSIIFTTKASVQNVVELKISRVSKDVDIEFSVDAGDATIKSAEASLSGVAYQWHCVDNVSYENSVSVEGELGVQTSGEGQVIIGSLAVLALVEGESNILTVSVEFEDEQLENKIIESDVTDLLSGFNDAQAGEKVLTNSIEIPSGSEVGELTITGWDYVEKDQIDLR